MNDVKTDRPADAPADPIKSTSTRPGRRQVLAGMAAASVVSALPTGVSAAVGNPIFAFLRVSSLITGIPLDKSYTQLGETILAALLSGEDDDGIAEWAELTERLEDLSNDASGEAIEQALTPSLLAKVRKLARVWYTGQIERADGRIDVIDYDEALVWRACAWTKPPATCGGPFGYWNHPDKGGRDRGTRYCAHRSHRRRYRRRRCRPGRRFDVLGPLPQGA